MSTVNEISNHPELMIGNHPLMQHIRKLVPQIGPLSVSVLILGEKGTEKEGLARILHNYSDRAHNEFVRFDCEKCLPSAASEELFGKDLNDTLIKKGQVDLAEGGTLFLDNVSALPRVTQAQLARLQRKKYFRRVNQWKPLNADVRLICADNQDLNTKIDKKLFRADLFYCFSVFLRIPPLRFRTEVIPVKIKNIS